MNFFFLVPYRTMRGAGPEMLIKRKSMERESWHLFSTDLQSEEKEEGGKEKQTSSREQFRRISVEFKRSNSAKNISSFSYPGLSRFSFFLFSFLSMSHKQNDVFRWKMTENSHYFLRTRNSITFSICLSVCLEYTAPAQLQPIFLQRYCNPALLIKGW